MCVGKDLSTCVSTHRHVVLIIMNDENVCWQNIYNQFQMISFFMIFKV